MALQSLATGRTNSSRSSFTLIELVCVLAIAALLMGLVVGIIGKIPTTLTFKNAISNIISLWDDASNQAELTGKVVVILYKDNLLYPQKIISGSDVNYLNYQIPSSIQVSFEKSNPNLVQYVFSPDGSSSGPKMTLSFKGHTALLGISKLTGMPLLSTDNEN